MNKLTDAKSYEDFEQYCLDKGYTLSELASKKSYFIKQCDRYTEIINWIDMFSDKHTTRRKITSELAKEYKDKYGGTQAVIMLGKELGIKITRQGLYAAIKRGGRDCAKER